MTISDIVNEKNLARDVIKSNLDLPKRSKTLVALYFSDETTMDKLISGLEILPVNFIIIDTKKRKFKEKNISQVEKIEDINTMGIDAIVCDCKDIKVEKLMEKGVVPIINEKNYLGKILTEFNAARGEGNAYLYGENSYWSVYYALIRYLENLKFPYDNRNLVKNVLGI